MQSNMSGVIKQRGFSQLASKVLTLSTNSTVRGKSQGDIISYSKYQCHIDFRLAKFLWL